MPEEEWTIHALLSGEFVIADESHASQSPLIEGLRRLEIAPQFDEAGTWTGLHELDAVVAFDTGQQATVDAHVVWDRVRDLLDGVCALASLGIGRPVRVAGKVSAKHRLTDEPPKYRFITGAEQVATIGPPAPLPATLLTMAVDPRVRRVVRWWARRVSASDAIDGLISLNNALDLLAGMTDGATPTVRRCTACGTETTLEPGQRSRVMHLLTDVLQYPEAQARDICDSRNDLAHGGSDLQEEDLRRYRHQADLVADAVREGVARALGVTLPPLPTRLPVDPHSALLDVEYVEG